MKSFKNSFLFFVFCTFFLIAKTGFTQQKIDSTAYYVSILSQIKSSDDFIKPYQFFQKDLKKELRINNIERVVYNLNYLSMIEYKLGFNHESEASAVKALKLIDNQKSSSYYKRFKTVFYNRLGILYKEQYNAVKASKMYNNCLVLAETAKDSMTLYNNISNVLKEDKQFKKAELELLKAYNLFDRVDDNKEKVRVLDNLGFIKFKLNKPNALNLMQNALESRKEAKDSSEIYISYNHLSNYYKDKNDLSKAKELAIKAYDISRLINSTSLIEDALKLRLDSEDYSIIKEYRTLSDSLLLARQQNQNKFALIKYEVSEKELQARESELQSQRDRTKRQLYQFIAALIFIIGIALYFILKTKHKKEKLQEVYNTETRISKKVHDEVANDVYQVMTKLQANTNVNEDVLDDLEDIYTKTRDISKENSAIDVKLAFDELLKDLLLSYKSSTINVITKNISKIDWNTISETKKTTIYRILQELMTNMKKHSKATIVVLSFNQNNKKLFIDYNDNGVGCNLQKNNGLQNTEIRIKSINGTITFESNINKGFKAKIAV